MKDNYIKNLKVIGILSYKGMNHKIALCTSSLAESNLFLMQTLTPFSAIREDYELNYEALEKRVKLRYM